MVAELVCGTVGVIFLGAYALAWRVMAWERADFREDLLRLKRETEGERLQCEALYTGRYGKGVSTLRCELEVEHPGPHTAQLDGYVRNHWDSFRQDDT